MIAKLMKLLSGVAALVGRRRPVESDDLAVLTTMHRRQLSRNIALIREKRVLNVRLRQMESMSDANRGNEHAAELDRVKDILHRHGLNVSRMQIASAVQDLSERLEATSIVVRKLEACNAAADAAW